MSATPPLDPVLYPSPTTIFFDAYHSIVGAASQTSAPQAGGAGA